MQENCTNSNIRVQEILVNLPIFVKNVQENFVAFLYFRGLNLHDATIVLVGLAFKAVKLSALGGATTTFAVFAAVIIGSPNALLISGSR